ncbi:MAG: tyrosine-type recombinase/integrase [Lachnospiraceae bacterium]|nr:tyrosine-type recombinase/integrase [Lachnospiraceae bacterium]
MNDKNYHEQMNIENTTRMREIVSELPGFCRQFFRGIEDRASARTRLAYAYDLRVFFEFLKTNNPSFKGKELRDIRLDVLEQLGASDIEEYMEYLTYYEKDGKEYTNDERGKARKLSALRSLYKYFHSHELIEKNPAMIVRTPKIHEKEIIRLDSDEVAMLLDKAESGEDMTPKQKAYHEKTRLRDMALLTLLLGTGIRVSECVGLDIDDVDFKNNGVKVRRKGGNETVVYFGTEVEDALLDYMNERDYMHPASGHEEALFLSLQNRRITVRAVEKLVKKYAKLVTSVKKITPHKLRSTYGTSLYRETGDIYLVADVLGHKDVNTTRRHYAAMEDERRRSAANVVKLRD